MEYTLTQLADQPEGSYLLIDIRDEGSYDYGSIDGAVNMPDVLGEKMFALTIILFGVLTTMPVITGIGIVYLVSLPRSDFLREIKQLL